MKARMQAAVLLEFFESTVRKEHYDTVDLPSGSTQQGIFDRFSVVWGGIIHSPAPRYQPFEAEIWILRGKFFQEIKSGLVAPRQNMGDTGAGYADTVGELRLADIFGL